MLELIVTPAEDGVVALDWLQRRIPEAPPGYLRQLLRKGRVLRATVPLGAADALAAGERVVLPGSARLRELLQAEPSPTLAILYETRELLVVAKPSGLAVHSSRGHEEDNLTARVQALLRERGDRFQVAPVHRLDAETSGPVLFGKGHAAIARLGGLFMSGAVAKCYLGLAAGSLSGDGWLESPIPAKGKLKAARTGYRVLSGNRRLTLLELYPETGRQHQLRRQLADAGHPLAGDRRYRGPALPGLSRLFLHCRQLAFTDPFQGAPLAIDAPLPGDLATLLARLGLKAGS